MELAPSAHSSPDPPARFVCVKVWCNLESRPGRDRVSREVCAYCAFSLGARGLVYEDTRRKDRYADECDAEDELEERAQRPKEPGEEREYDGRKGIVEIGQV